MRLKIFFLLVGPFFAYHIVTAQTNSAYLTQVGTQDSVYSEVLHESRTYWVHYPPGYTPDADRKYPLVLLLDGEVWLPTLASVHEFYSGGFMPEMILVGLSNAENRTRDFTPTHVETKYGMPFPEPTGGGEAFSQFLISELLPDIETKYPVTDYRTLIGHSYGGLFAVYVLLQHPEAFANYLAIDPSIEWDQQVLLQQARANWESIPLQNKGLYIAMSGQLHMADPSVTIENVMEDATDFTLFSRSILSFGELAASAKQEGFRYSQDFFAQDLHGTVPVPAIRQGLINVFEWFQMEQTAKFNNFESPAKELADIVQYRAEKLERYFGYPVPPYPEELMNMSGYMSMDMGQMDKAKMFFESGMMYYPQSANAYDSMADYYEQAEDFAKALALVTQAYEISGSEYHRERMETLKGKTR
ncbi:MAG: alpha/beta hydrolase-fold protein [Bacteroidota bacterium]